MSITPAAVFGTKPGRSRHAPPRASSMLEALRGFGYSTATALADIVDNSLSAHASAVDIQFCWQGEESTITIADNGAGMDEHELDSAMRLGTRDTANVRAADDLGRFGVGLKTASFSQCRVLTVASRKDGRSNCLRWDLDRLAASEDDGWHLLEDPAPGSEHLLEPLGLRLQGTLVIWEKLDRIVTLAFTEQDFLDLIDNVERHLAMTFHRFLSGTRPRVKLNINGRAVVPWDPFLRSQTATWSSPIQRIPADRGAVEVQCHVLPHKDHLSPHDNQAGGGPNGWTAQQGFYVYRNERLLVAGSWLGLGRGRHWTKEEAHRLARIRLDIPNTADADWRIDIRKSTARPPVSLKEHLTLLAEDTRKRARHVFAHRGQPRHILDCAPVVYAWNTIPFSGGVRYRINEDHPAVRTVLENAGSLDAQIRTMLRVIEETIPVQRIWLDTTEVHETPRTSFGGEASSEILEVLSSLYRNMIHRKQLAPELARKILLNTEPFNNYPELVSALPNELSLDSDREGFLND